MPPRFERGAREGCGDSMMGALSYCLGRRPGVGGDAAAERRGRGRAQLPARRPRQRLARGDRGPRQEGRAAVTLGRAANLDDPGRRGAPARFPVDDRPRAPPRASTRGGRRPARRCEALKARGERAPGDRHGRSGRRCRGRESARPRRGPPSRLPSARAGRSRRSPGPRRSGADQAGDALIHIGGEVALGVGDQGPVAALAELRDRSASRLSLERPRSGLEQDPAAPAERDQARAPPRRSPSSRASRPPPRRAQNARPRFPRRRSADVERHRRARQAPPSARHGRGGCGASRRSLVIPSSAAWRAMPDCRGDRGRRRRAPAGCGSAGRSRWRGRD